LNLQILARADARHQNQGTKRFDSLAVGHKRYHHTPTVQQSNNNNNNSHKKTISIMFRKATPTAVRHLRRCAVSTRATRPIAQRAIASSLSVLSSKTPFTTTQSRFKSSVAAVEEEVCVPTGQPPFKKILAANRGEIATRINRAAAELGAITAGIYSYEGMFFEIKCGCGGHVVLAVLGKRCRRAMPRWIVSVGGQQRNLE
jgi:hypothetical protein